MKTQRELPGDVSHLADHSTVKVGSGKKAPVSQARRSFDASRIHSRGPRPAHANTRDAENAQARKRNSTPKMAGVVRVAHRFPFRGSPHRDPSTYLLSPARLLTRHAEDFRQLRSLIKSRLGSSGILMVASARHAEGRSIAALNISITLAQEFARVVYLEADFRRPALHTFFDIPTSKGTANLLRGHQRISRVGRYMLATDVAGLYLLPAGVRSGPPDLLESPRLPELFERLRSEADWTIVDCSPLLSYSDALPLIGLVDGIVIITMEGRSREEDLVDLSARLANAHAQVVDTIYIER